MCILNFFTLETRFTFTKLRQVFTKIQIKYYFEPDYYICINKDLSNYAI